MQTVLGRTIQSRALLVGLALVVVLLAAAAVLLWIAGLPDTQPLVGPFRWAPRPIA